MVLDTDSPQAWIRSDVIVTGAISDALLYRPKQNTFYDVASAVQIAAGKEAQYKSDLLEMENADEGLEQQAVQWSYEEGNECGGEGSLWSQQHR
jgi:hypothetical protein